MSGKINIYEKKLGIRGSIELHHTIIKQKLKVHNLTLNYQKKSTPVLAFNLTPTQGLPDTVDSLAVDLLDINIAPAVNKIFSPFKKIALIFRSII